jgi:hypothetical protein
MTGALWLGLVALLRPGLLLFSRFDMSTRDHARAVALSRLNQRHSWLLSRCL